MPDTDQVIEVAGKKVRLSVEPASDKPEVEVKPDEIKAYLDSMVGEGKKYKTVEDLAKGAAHAQEHIAKLEKENNEFRDQFNKFKSNDELISEVTKRLDALSSRKPEPDEDDGLGDGDDKPMDIQALVQKTVQEVLTETESKKKAETEQERKERNQALSWDALAKMYNGDAAKAEAVVREYVGTDANRAAALTMLSETLPEEFVRLVSGKKADPTIFTDQSKRVVPPRSDESGELTWAKARAIRKESPDMFYSREFQTALVKARDRNPNFWQGTKRQK